MPADPAGHKETDDVRGSVSRVGPALLTEHVLAGWHGHLTHRSLPRSLASRMRAAGFPDVEMLSHVFATAEFDAEIYGGATVPVIGASSRTARVSAKTMERDGRGTARVGPAGEFYFAVSQFCFTATRPM